MILIADSGSTKCHWACLNEKNSTTSFFDTVGLNPYFFSDLEIIKELKKSALQKISKDIKKVFFYGAGCSSASLKKTIFKSLSKFFVDAEIFVEHDLIGACRATYNNKKSINCIIGTGSIACLYDGKDAVPSVPSLGFILGDEGSGNYFGKKLLNLYFNKKLPSRIKQKFEKKHDLCYEDLLVNVYQNNRANSFLSSFFPFIIENQSFATFNQILDEGVEDFLRTHVFCIQNYNTYPINFIGSVAYFLKDIILEKAQKHNFSVGSFLRNPIKNLAKYHA